MSLWADYKKERDGKDVIEWKDGFAAFKINSDKTCWLSDIYVKPECRQDGVGRKLSDAVGKIAKDMGCNTLLGTVDIFDSLATESMKAQFGVGFKLLRIDGNLIVLSKEL